MTLNSSGPLSFKAIAQEKGVAQTNISLKTLSTEDINTYDTTPRVPANTSTLPYNRPDEIAPYRVSEFYAYNANATTTTAGPPTTGTTTTSSTTTTTSSTTTTTSSTTTTTRCYTQTIAVNGAHATTSTVPTICTGVTDMVLYLGTNGKLYTNATCTAAVVPGNYPSSSAGWYFSVTPVSWGDPIPCGATTTCAPSGTNLYTICEGVDEYQVKADGSCGTFTVLLEANSIECGYTTTTTTTFYVSTLAVSTANRVASGIPNTCDGSTDTTLYLGANSHVYTDPGCTTLATAGSYPAGAGFYVVVNPATGWGDPISCGPTTTTTTTTHAPPTTEPPE